MLGRLDGEAYRRILEYGYDYSTERTSIAVFFPGYPLLARPLYDCGLPAQWALLGVSWLSLLGAFRLAQLYLKERLPEDGKIADMALAALALNPMAFYMRFMYSESAFLLFLLFLLVLMQRRASPVVVALVCGALTGIRPHGVAVIPVVLVYAWNHSAKSRLINLAFSLAACGWGLSMFAWWLYMSFDNPLAFIHAQEPYARQSHTFGEKLWSMATLGPFRRMFDPDSSGFWDKYRSGSFWVFNNHVGDAFSWVLFAFLIGLGAYKRWLNRQELLLSILLFAFSTWFQADRSDMECQGRYMSVIVPAYITLGRLLAAIRSELLLALAATAAGLYIHYAAMFAIGNAW